LVLLAVRKLASWGSGRLSGWGGQWSDSAGPFGGHACLLYRHERGWLESWL
jgi:hypothetical protein